MRYGFGMHIQYIFLICIHVNSLNVLTFVSKMDDNILENVSIFEFLKWTTN